MAQERSCKTCKYEHHTPRQIPCNNCGYHNNWQPADAPEVADAPVDVTPALVVMCQTKDEQLRERAKRIAELEDEVERHQERSKATYCAFCSCAIDVDDDAATKIQAHVHECEFHPIREVKKERDALKSEVASLKKLAGDQAEYIMQLQKRLSNSSRVDYAKEQDRRDRFFASAMQALICADTNEDASFHDIIDYAKKYATAAMEAATIKKEDKEK